MRIQWLCLLAGTWLGLHDLAPAQIPYAGGTLTENFDAMGPEGTNAPAGWRVGYSTNMAPASTVGATDYLVVSAGGAQQNGEAGFNLGETNQSNRTLGLGATGTGAPAGTAARFIEVQIRNESPTLSLDAITVRYAGEMWRSGSTGSNTFWRLLLSRDGVTYTDMGTAFRYTQTRGNTPNNTRYNGHTNNTPNIGGVYNLNPPLAPGSLIYLRWFDYNDSGTDPILGIDDFSFSGNLTNIAPTLVILTPTNNQPFPIGATIPVTSYSAGPISDVGFFVDAVWVGADSATPFTASVPTDGLSLGTHLLTATATNTTGGTISTNVNFRVVTNAPPVIAITNLYSGSVTGQTFLVGCSINIQADVRDDVAVTAVDWYLDGALHVTRPSPNFNFAYNDSLAGTHTIYGVAADTSGHVTTSEPVMLTVTNPPANFALLITNGSEWKYYGTGAAPPVDGIWQWYDYLYNDGTWAAGMAELGNGDTRDGYPEQTMIDIGPSNNVYRTIYFRKVVSIADPSQFPNVIIRLLRDDGAVVWINSHPVWTNNIPAATNGLTYNTLAAGSDDGVGYQVFNGTPADLYLDVGDNLIAVEVHQQSAASSDLSFDLMLWGEQATAPVVVITSPTNDQSFVEGVNVAVAVSTSTFVTNVGLWLDGVPLSEDATPPFAFTVTNISPGWHTLTAIGHDQFGAGVTSAPVVINVVPDLPPTVAITNSFNATNRSGFFLVGTIITNQLSASDDVGVTNVNFFINGVFYARDSSSPFGPFLVVDSLAGSNVFTAVAADTRGHTNTAAPVLAVVTNPPYALLATNGSTWKYLDSGVAPPAAWATLGFDDTTWSNGVADLGYGDAGVLMPERTLIRRVGDLGTTNDFFYFRKVFNLLNPAAYTNLIVSLLRDDGGRVYLNGNLVFTSPATYPPTTAVGDDGTAYARGNVSPTNLVSGSNVVAVEIAQEAPSSSDVTFDLMLWGQGIGAVSPLVAIERLANETLRISWTPSGGHLESTEQLASPPGATVWSNEGSVNPTIRSPTGTARFYRVVTP